MDVSRLAFVVTLTVASLAVSFAAGLYSGVERNAAFRLVQSVKITIDQSLAAFDETSFAVPEHFLQPARAEGAGVTINAQPDDAALILLSGFFDDGNELRLIRRDGSIVRRWPVEFSALFPKPDHMQSPPATDWNVDIHGALIQPDGSVVFNFEYGGLVKLDRCAAPVWTVRHPTHHSVEQADHGTFWVPGRRRPDGPASAFRPFTPPFNEDLLVRVSTDGRVLSEISVPEILYENGLEALITAGELFDPNVPWDRDLVHLNKIDKLTSDIAAAFPEFAPGDLLISLRRSNLVVVVGPEARRIKWWQTGPWIRQHDPEFNQYGTLTVFNNNAYRNALLPQSGSDPAASRTTNIMRINPRTRELRVAYGGRADQEMLTVLRGKHEVTESGGFLITEFEAGRVLETNSEGQIVWEYINRYDRENVAEITEARLDPREYFTVEDWSCPRS